MNFPVRMIHEKHGATHANNSDDYQRLLALGWQLEKRETITVKKRAKVH